MGCYLKAEESIFFYYLFYSLPKERDNEFILKGSTIQGCGDPNIEMIIPYGIKQLVVGKCTLVVVFLKES